MKPEGRPDDATIADALMRLAHQRGLGKSFCPSEAARALASEDWRPLLPEVRRVARNLQLLVLQKGVPVDPQRARGPIRLTLAARCDD